MKKNDFLRTWIELDKKALVQNIGQFLKFIPVRTRLMAVVKSNAYGHGLAQVAKQLAELGVKNNELGVHNSKFIIHNSRLWFGVDSIVEALRLREEGKKNSILVLGSTLPGRFKEAEENNIILTVSNFESLGALKKLKNPPEFHIKIDTGMYRQGFLPEQIQKLLKLIKLYKLAPEGIYTHFASAKDRGYPTYTFEQLRKFKQAIKEFERAGFRKLIKHAAASGGTILFPSSHLDMVRIGIGLYGYWPAPETEKTFRFQGNPKSQSPNSKLSLKPVLTWKTIVGEVTEIPKGSHIGYDFTERINRKTKIAVLPIGYWHGYDRGLSSIGEVLLRGRRRKILGRVSMDMIVVDVTDKPSVKVGNEAVLLGKQGKDAIWADEIALKIGTSAYEVLTRINPLIERN